MNVEFWKMHGAGNDFVLIDDRSGAFPVADSAWIARIAARRTGIGCEGVILIQRAEHADIRMRFFNPDGTEVEMCGNGARCVARLAYELGAAPERMSIATAAGVLNAEVRPDSDSVLLEMTVPTDWRLDQTLALDGRGVAYDFVNSGVPHVVVQVDGLDGYDVAGIGARIRYHSEFAPAGTNANFIEVVGPQALRVRTYERGVEAETLACGTGIVASALVAGRQGRVAAPVSVLCGTGDQLEVNFTLTDNGAADVTLLGPAAHVFRGSVVYEG